MNRKYKTSFPLAFATALLLTCGWAAPTAFADELIRSETVKFPDLNVTTQEGVQRLYTRIHTAAERVCAERDPILRLSVNACINKAEQNAIANANLSQLSAYYKNKTKTGDHTLPLVAAR